MNITLPFVNLDFSTISANILIQQNWQKICNDVYNIFVGYTIFRNINEIINY